MKGQLEQKKQKNDMEDPSSPEGDVLENGGDSNIMDIQSKKLPALGQLQGKSFRNCLQLTMFIALLAIIFNRFGLLPEHIRPSASDVEKCGPVS